MTIDKVMKPEELENTVNLISQLAQTLPQLRLPNKVAGRSEWVDRQGDYEKNLHLLQEGINALLEDHDARYKSSSLMNVLFNSYGVDLK